ncbi:MAG: hypothetical protein WCJ84_03100 [Candidatus Peregrinibacteria bacterium]
MRQIDAVYITEHCVEFLKQRNLEAQWHKVKDLLLNGNIIAVDFKKRRPYKSEKYLK